jgi:hypothetical protein
VADAVPNSSPRRFQNAGETTEPAREPCRLLLPVSKREYAPRATNIVRAPCTRIDGVSENTLTRAKSS